MRGIASSIFDSIRKGEMLDLVTVSVDTVIDIASNERDIFSNVPGAQIMYAFIKAFDNFRAQFMYNKTIKFFRNICEDKLDKKALMTHLDGMNQEELETEVGHILIYLESIKRTEKVILMSKIYVSYIKKEISYEIMQDFFEVIEKLLSNDILTLRLVYNHYNIDSKQLNISSANRLESLGLINKYDILYILLDPSDAIFCFTVNKFGEEFCRIIFDTEYYIDNETFKYNIIYDADGKFSLGGFNNNFTDLNDLINFLNSGIKLISLLEIRLNDNSVSLVEKVFEEMRRLETKPERIKFSNYSENYLYLKNIAKEYFPFAKVTNDNDPDNVL